MVLLDVPQGSRALAVILPSVTLIAHALTFFFLHAFFAETWGMSYLAWYDVLAMTASGLGVFGAVKRCIPLITFYIFIHGLLLTTMSLILVGNILPASAPDAFPVLHYIRYDSGSGRWMCHELDDGFGWDALWFEQCMGSFRSLMTGFAWMGSVLMTAQWWALVEVWRWNAGLDRRRRERRGDLEKEGMEKAMSC